MSRLLKSPLVVFALLIIAGYATRQDQKKETPAERRERLAVAVQAICPVSGEPLTDHASPVKMVNPETKEVLYVCCEHCLNEKPNPKHVETIRKNLAKAQGKCLVMSDNEISEKSKHEIVGGRFVNVCCPPCVKKLSTDSEKYLKALDERYEAALKQK